MQKLLLIITIISIVNLNAQDGNTQELPYYEIPEAPENYTAGTVASRMIDGLGYRYYWATNGLREEDLKHRASDTGRSSQETIHHVFELSNFILNAIANKKDKPDKLPQSFIQKRAKTLINFKKASDILKNSSNISKYDNTRFPFWNIINGPIADALWHCGQIVMLRRASGNPFNSKVGLLSGKVRQ
ncbi:hypothetical protein GCM10022291_25250 [Postechiella marina]|uniref:DinB family protein n=1 Tax=Postechiella marina TaxID=943941 RepID=A0ABP8CD49_9FLAO